VDRLKKAAAFFTKEASAAADYDTAMTSAHFCPIYDQKVNFL
jgi:hypothetical protein